MYRHLCLQSDLTKQLHTYSKEILKPTAKSRMKPAAKMRPKPPDHPPPGHDGDGEVEQQPMQVDADGEVEQQPMQVDADDGQLTTQEQAKNILQFDDTDVYDELYKFMKDDSDVG
jgi:hypothetical protein